MRRRGDRQREIGEYVRARLTEECGKARGIAAAIARATGFTTSHVAQVQRPGVGIGENFARAMAAYWGMTYPQLEETAKDWARQHPVPASRPSGLTYRQLSELPGWPEALEEAKQKWRSIPAEIWEQTGAAVLPNATEATIERVGRVAALLFDTSPGQPGHDKDLTAPHRQGAPPRRTKSSGAMKAVATDPKRKAHG